MRNLTYLSWIVYALIISGYIVALALPQGSIVGYSCVVIGLFSLIMLKMVPLSHDEKITFSSLLPMMPFILVLGLSSWLLAINVKYSKNIQKGNVTNDYTKFNVINFILLLAELVILQMRDFKNGTLVVSLLASFQLVIIFVLQMNLEYFITDG